MNKLVIYIICIIVGALGGSWGFQYFRAQDPSIPAKATYVPLVTGGCLGALVAYLINRTGENFEGYEKQNEEDEKQTEEDEEDEEDEEEEEDIVEDYEGCKKCKL